MLRRVVIPAKDLKEQQGMTFMHVSSVSTYMLALCCSAQHGRRPLSKTNIVEQLTALRNAKTIANEPVQEELQSFSNARVGEQRKRMRHYNLLHMVKVDKDIWVDTILSPTLGDVQGIEMKILGHMPNVHPYMSNSTQRTLHICATPVSGRSSMIN